MIFDSKKNYNKNALISLALIVSFVLTPVSIFFALPKQAEAQLAGVSGYVSGLAPAIARLPLCKKFLNNQMKGLFTGIKNVIGIRDHKSSFGTAGAKGDTDASTFGASEIDPALYADISKNMEGLTKTLDKEARDLTMDSIKTNNPKLEDSIEKILEKQNSIEKTNAALAENDNCYKSIGRLISKMLIQKLTISMVNWINSGFDGSPAFLQNPGKFFGDIAKSEILQFGLEIDNDELYPFGKDWLRNTVTAFNTKAQDNMKYSLNELIQETTPEYSAITFREDFSKGGWNAWSALTQVPANNPIGFKVLADNEIQRRLAGTSESRAEGIKRALQEADGFLGDERCVDPPGVTKEMHQAALEATPSYTLCKEWKYVTAGRTIADAAGLTMEHEISSYLNVEDLNDAIAAMLDAILGKFTSTIMEKGYANYGNDGAGGRLVFADNGSGPYRTRAEKDYAPVHLTSSWLQANPDFDIRTDLTQALIDEQRTYSDKLALQNKELFSTTDGKNYILNAENAATWSSGNGGSSGVWANDNISGTWTATNGTGGTGIANWKTTTNTGVLELTWTSATGSGTWTLNTNGGWGATAASSGTWGATGLSNAYGLLPAIYQLDYCIPGPHPGWEYDSQRVLAAQMDLVIPHTAESLKDADTATILGMARGLAPLAGAVVGPIIAAGVYVAAGGTIAAGATVGSVVPVLGTIIGAAVGAAIVGIVSLFGGASKDEKVRSYYASQIAAWTGYLPDYKDDNDDRTLSLESKSGMVHIMNEIFNRYVHIMNKTYFSSSDILPNVAKEAATLFRQTPGYNQMIRNNEEKISLLKTTVNLLGEIKDKVDEINLKYKDGGGQFYPDKSETDYENELKPQINAFGRLSASMVNGDDIASADNLLKQIIDKKNYVYKNLLKGPYGCEADLEKEQKRFPGTGSTTGEPDWDDYNALSVARMTYPFPILYSYNIFDKYEDIGTNLPDPWVYLWENGVNPYPTKVPDSRLCADTNGNNIDCGPVTGQNDGIYTHDEGNRQIYGQGSDQNMYGGFLSFVFFTSNGDDESKLRGPERLKIHDLVPQWGKPDHRHKALGFREGKYEGKYPYAGPFEGIIGIY